MEVLVGRWATAAPTRARVVRVSFMFQLGCAGSQANVVYRCYTNTDLSESERFSFAQENKGKRTGEKRCANGHGGAAGFLFVFHS